MPYLSSLPVTNIELNSTNINSALPADLAMLTGLERCILSNNGLVGTIPSSLHGHIGTIKCAVVLETQHNE
jgi:hypothetical protein